MAVENTYIGLFIFWVLYGILTKIIKRVFSWITGSMYWCSDWK